MSTLWYSGISLEDVQVVECSRRAQYDARGTYMFTRWRIWVRALYHPSATSYADDQGRVVVPSPGSSAAFTDATIRHQLMQPRGKLVFTAAGPGAKPGDPPNLAVDGLGGQGGGLTVLDSPPSLIAGGGPPSPNFSGSPGNDQYLTDCANGPLPVACNVREVTGLKMFWVEFIVEASVNECFNYYSNPAVLLSHTWRQTHDVDRDGFTTRRVQGRGIFRGDVLGNNARPDDYRAALFAEIPNNTVRENVVVIAEDDGLTLSYSYTDREVSHNIIPANVTRLEAYARVRRGTPSGFTVAKAVTGWAGIKAALSGNFTGAVGAALGAAEGALPRMGATVVVRAWGNRRASRAQLRSVCSKVLTVKLPAVFAKIPGSTLPVAAYGLQTETIYDLVGRYVELRMSFEVDFPGRLAMVAGADADSMFPELVKDDIPDVAVTGSKAGRMAVVNDPLAPGVLADRRNRCRGTFLEVAVSQALSGACRNPGEPVNSAAVARQLPVPGS